MIMDFHMMKIINSSRASVAQKIVVGIQLDQKVDGEYIKSSEKPPGLINNFFKK